MGKWEGLPNKTYLNLVFLEHTTCYVAPDVGLYDDDSSNLTAVGSPSNISPAPTLLKRNKIRYSRTETAVK